MRLRVLSYNIRGQASARTATHIEAVAETIVRLQPDVVGLQEVHRFTARSRALDQAGTLASLTGMELAFGRTLEGWGGEYGNAILSRLPVVSSEVHSLPGRGEPRAVLSSRIEAGGREIAVLDAHLEAWGFLRRATRAAQLQRLSDLTAALTVPWVLVGDFNAVPSAGEIRSFLSSEHLQLCGEHEERSFRYTLQRLDYIVACRSARTHYSRVERAGPSDHWPLLAEIEL